MSSSVSRRGVLLLTTLLACGGAPASPAPSPVASATVVRGVTPTPAAKPFDWVAASNENTKLLLAVNAAFVPEEGSRLGVDGLDDHILDWSADREVRLRAAYEKALETLKAKRATEPNRLVQQDLEILIRSAELSIKQSKIEEENAVPYLNVSELVFGSANALLDEQVAPARRPAFVARLRKYAGMDGQAPITDLAKARITTAMKNPKLSMPTKIELEKHVQHNGTMRDGIKKLLEKHGIKGWEEPYAAMMKQLVAYDDFVKTTMLPKARTSFALPPALYAIALERYGVEMPPAELATVAHQGFTEIQAEMKVVAAEVAKARNLPSSDYRDVIRALKKEQLGSDAILPHYKARLAEVESIMRREKLVTLPTRPARIRLGTPAESAEQPAPHMSPPRLIGNTGEQGEFVLPLEIAPDKGTRGGKEETKLDDFTFAAASWTLTAHEARPGHEMQFAAMIEHGVSNARAIFAFNSANVEGWGLYSEAMMLPFMPAEGKLISLQLRLQRAVRAFVDPELQQGKWTFESAKAFLVKEVGLSPAFATTEVERYTFRAPGQATSYWYGYMKLRELRKDVEAAQGARFDAMKFHDFVLAQGLLPPRLIREATLAELK